MSTNSPLSPSRSVESGLDKTPMRRGANVKNDDWVFATPEKPSLNSSKNNRKVLGSIERGLDKMKNMLTPRKHRLSSNGDGPGTVDVWNPDIQKPNLSIIWKLKVRFLDAESRKLENLALV